MKTGRYLNGWHSLFLLFNVHWSFVREFEIFIDDEMHFQNSTVPLPKQDNLTYELFPAGKNEAPAPVSPLTSRYLWLNNLHTLMGSSMDVIWELGNEEYEITISCKGRESTLGWC